MEQIIINTDQRVNSERSCVLQTVRCGTYFEKFLDSQKKSDTKPNGMTPEGIVTFREETTDILSHCNPHNAVANRETTHLVVGYVQSGKTMSFTGLTALALDNNYRVIVYLAGTKNNLLDQTKKRLRKDLVSTGSRYCDKYKIHANPTNSDMDDILGHLESMDKPIILIPILKHYDHINKLAAIFDSIEFKEIMADETVLIIDDEADQASLNSYGRRNSQRNEDEMSRTYDSILHLRSVLHGNTYIQYTATPQANILISMQDMLSPKSHTLLTPGEGYIGGRLFFGKGENNNLYNGRLIKEIPANQVFHKRRNPLSEMPQSLKDALMLHILAVAIVVKWQKVEGVNYLSMMVHPDNTKRWNRKFKEWIEAELRLWRRLLSKQDGHDDKEALLSRFESLLPKALEFYDPSECPTFGQLKPYIPEVLRDKKVYLVNTDSDAQTEIQWDDYKMHILVGAEMLNRGFTIEKLATTYMPRYTTGATNADTIQQRCRFFGYKMDYIKSCRVFLPESSIDNYRAYIDHEEELRSMLASCDTLAAAERKVLLSPRLRPTRTNVLPIWVVNTRLSGMHALQAFASKATIESNTRIVKEFLAKHEQDFNILYEYNTKDRTHRGFKLKIDDAIELLSDFSFNNWPDARRKAETIRYLRYLSGDGRSNPLEYVYFIQMAFDAPIRERSFNADTCRLAENTALFAGPSSKEDSTNYPGDSKIVEEDSITIQLHHIHLKGAPIEFGAASDAYTLAINYPSTFAANYYSNEQEYIDDDDEEDDEE